MKKIKLALMATAILLSVGGAFATKLHSDCTGNVQYYFNGTSYIQAGVYGYNYICMDGPSSTCTYYILNGSYAACQPGVYTTIPH